MLDLEQVATACSEDSRFQEACWPESANSLAALMVSPAYEAALFRIAPLGKPAPLNAIVAAVYACRVIERGKPKVRWEGHRL